MIIKTTNGCLCKVNHRNINNQYQRTKLLFLFRRLIRKNGTILIDQGRKVKHSHVTCWVLQQERIHPTGSNGASFCLCSGFLLFFNEASVHPQSRTFLIRGRTSNHGDQLIIRVLFSDISTCRMWLRSQGRSRGNHATPLNGSMGETNAGLRRERPGLLSARPSYKRSCGS